MNFKNKLNFFALGGTFIIFFFSTVSVIFSLLVSYLIGLSNLKIWILDRTGWINLALIGLSIFLIMSGVIYWVDSFLVEVHNFLVSKMGKIMLGAVAISSFSVLLLILYFSLPVYLVFLRNQFWL